MRWGEGFPWAHLLPCTSPAAEEMLLSNINVMLLHAGARSVLSESAFAALLVALKFHCIFPAQSAGLAGTHFCMNLES